MTRYPYITMQTFSRRNDANAIMLPKKQVSMFHQIAQVAKMEISYPAEKEMKATKIIK